MNVVVYLKMFGVVPVLCSYPCELHLLSLTAALFCPLKLKTPWSSPSHPPPLPTTQIIVIPKSLLPSCYLGTASASPSCMW